MDCNEKRKDDLQSISQEKSHNFHRNVWTPTFIHSTEWTEKDT